MKAVSENYIDYEMKINIKMGTKIIMSAWAKCKSNDSEKWHTKDEIIHHSNVNTMILMILHAYVVCNVRKKAKRKRNQELETKIAS